MNKVLVALSCIILFLGVVDLSAQRLSRDFDMRLLTNQVGYLPLGHKGCVMKGTVNAQFQVIDIQSGKTYYTGTLTPTQGKDFGAFLTGDFSSLTREGKYYLRSDSARSYPFSISSGVYQEPINMIASYFSKQRCGASTTGYLAPCHVDDGIRFDNGKHQDVSGGWHDASDLRKWVSATLYGMIGLAKAYNFQDKKYQKAFLDELLWGNRYFLQMQEPDGFVMSFVGGDLKKHSDNNRWTDNKIETGNGAIELITPNAGRSKQLMLVAGKSDDRIIQTAPVERVAQYNFITAEAMMARITASDPSYAKRCINAAIKCYNWCQQSGKDTGTATIGAALEATIELYKSTKAPAYKQRATVLVRELKRLQANNSNGPSGFFYNSPGDHEPYKNIWLGCQAFIGLSDLLTLFPADTEAQTWKTMLQKYANDYLLFLSTYNGFGIVPWGLYETSDPGGNRKSGDYWYRYFMQPELEWWVGINAHVASTGVGLLKASAILKDKRLKAVAQKQLDWILGSNPLNSSTMVGVGYNHPAHFAGSSFLPTVPLIPGAVINGLGGSHEDEPVAGKGDWQISEYWTPMVAYTLWLMAELSAGK